tara:strand:+ start:372 stop:1112 length:741 start_codon:yes stop_codon:yes gene_type:complete
MRYLIIFGVLLFISCQSDYSENNDVDYIDYVTNNDIDSDGVPDDVDLDNNTRSGAQVDQNGIMLNPIYLDTNGVTIKALDWAISGDIGQVNDISYTVVDENMLRQMVLNDEDITKVCTTKVKVFTQLFVRKNSFNQLISSWDLSNAEGLNFMFFGATDFNQDISLWNVSNATDMNFMFKDARAFNQNISNWDTSNVLIMREIFYGAESFNQDLSSWNVSKVNDCQSAFTNAGSWTLPKPDFTRCVI